MIKRRHIPKIRAKQPHPWNWFTCVDGFDLLGLQCQPKVAPKAELYFLDTRISYVDKRYTPPKRDPVKTELGTIHPEVTPAREVVPYTSETNPADRVYTQEEVLADIQSSGLAAGLNVPEAGGVIRRQCLRVEVRHFDIPKPLEEQGYLDGCTHVLVDMMSTSSWTGVIEKLLNIRLPSLTVFMRNLLMEHDVLKRSELPHHSRMRSVLQLRSVIGIDVDTRKEYGFTNILTNDYTNTEPSEALSDSLSQGKFYKDTAEAVSLPPFNFDGFKSKPRAYEFKNWGFPTILKLGPDWSEMVKK